MKKHIILRAVGMILALLLTFSTSLQVFALDSGNAAAGDDEYIGKHFRAVNPVIEHIENYSAAAIETDLNEDPIVYTAFTREELMETIRSALADRVAVFTVKCRDLYDPQGVFDEIFDHTGNPKYGDYLRWNFQTIDFALSGDRFFYYYRFTSKYLSNAEQERAVDEKIPSVMASLDLDNKDDYNKIKAIYAYVCDNVSYDYKNLNDPSYTLKHSTYAALIDGEAVCQGFATLFYRMCLEAGIDARLIAGLADTGRPQKEAHAWNIVRLGDYYYNMDSTWDDESFGNYFYFLKGESFARHFPDDEYLTADFKAKYPIAKSDYVYDPGDIVYKLTDDGKTMIISGTGILSGTQPWVFNAKNVTKIIVEEGITSIASEAFKNCPLLERIEIAQSVEYIDNNAFSGCVSMTDICCKAESQPAGWENNWLGDCSATVHWSYIGIIIDDIKPDLDGDGVFGESDLIVVLNYIKGLSQLTDEQLKAADVNNDGIVDIRDFNLMFYAFQLG